MRHYLLFDSSCAKCARIAGEVERVSGGWLEARSLRDPAVQTLLNEATPSWRWRPMVLEVKHDHIRVYAGIAMGKYLVKKLGIRRSLQLARLVLRTRRDARIVNSARRQFLGQSTLSFAALALGLHWRKSQVFTENPESYDDGQLVSQSRLSQEALGELYEGFLLLPEDAIIPSTVTCTGGIMLHHGDPHGASTGETLHFDDLDDLANFLPFPFYVPTILPDGIQFMGCDVVRYAVSKEIYQVFVYYGSYRSDYESLQTQIAVWAERKYCRPYPLGPGQAVLNLNRVPVPPEKIAFTPSPGVLIPAGSGHKMHWIQNDTAYTLVVEHNQDRVEAIQIAESLATI